MKRNPSFALRSNPAFTLVELLVVIVIIGALAAVAFSVGPKMMTRGDAAKSVQNMRQIGALLGTYAADNSLKLPAPRGDVPNGKGGFAQLHWHEALMYLVYPDLEEKNLHDDKWWVNNRPFLRNPLCDAKAKPNAFTWWNPGYAMNRMIVENLGKSSGDWNPGKGGPQTYAIPLNMVPDGSRTPIIAPRGDWHFTYDTTEIKETGLQAFLVDKDMPILFIDGHVETIALKEYTRRELYKMPMKP